MTVLRSTRAVRGEASSKHALRSAQALRLRAFDVSHHIARVQEVEKIRTRDRVFEVAQGKKATGDAAADFKALGEVTVAEPREHVGSAERTLDRAVRVLVVPLVAAGRVLYHLLHVWTLSALGQLRLYDRWVVER